MTAITGTWTLSVILKDPRWASALVRVKARALPVSNLRLSGAVGGDKVLCQQGLGYIPVPMVRRCMPIRLFWPRPIVFGAHSGCQSQPAAGKPDSDCRPNVARLKLPVTRPDAAWRRQVSGWSDLTVT